jgi:hypothetical protein
MALGTIQPLVKMSTRNIPGGKGGRCVRLTTSPPLRAECHGTWELKPPGTLWATPGLLRDSFYLEKFSNLCSSDCDKPLTKHIVCIFSDKEQQYFLGSVCAIDCNVFSALAVPLCHLSFHPCSSLSTYLYNSDVAINFPQFNIHLNNWWFMLRCWQIL